MTYTFSIKKNIYMYNHLMMINDGHHQYEAIVESAPTKKDTLIIWLEDFGCDTNDIEIIKTEMEKWLKAQHITCIFNHGKGR